MSTETINPDCNCGAEWCAVRIAQTPPERLPWAHRLVPSGRIPPETRLEQAARWRPMLPPGSCTTSPRTHDWSAPNDEGLRFCTLCKLPRFTD